MLSLCEIRNKCTLDVFSLCLFLSILLSTYLPAECYNTSLPLSLRLTPFWSLKADCFLIGVVPGVMVVMETCKGYLEGLDLVLVVAG